MPGPQIDVLHELPDGKGVAEACKVDTTWAGVRPEFIEKRRATTPATCGVAMLVPE